MGDTIMADKEYVESLCPSIYQWLLERSATKRENSPIKVSECKEAFKSIHLTHLTAVFNLLVADSKLLVLDGKSRVTQYTLHDKHVDYLVRLSTQHNIETSKSSTATIAQKAAPASKPRARGLKERDANQQPHASDSHTQGEGKALKKMKKSTEKKNIQQKQGGTSVPTGLSAAEESPPHLATSAPPHRGTEGDRTDLDAAHSPVQYIPSSPGETDRDAIASSLMQSFTDGVIKYALLKSIVVKQFPNMSGEQLDKILSRFEKQNKIFVDGEDIYEI